VLVEINQLKSTELADLLDWSQRTISARSAHCVGPLSQSIQPQLCQAIVDQYNNHPDTLEDRNIISLQQFHILKDDELNFIITRSISPTTLTQAQSLLNSIKRATTFDRTAQTNNKALHDQIFFEVV
jgi:hypothetical protein